MRPLTILVTVLVAALASSAEPAEPGEALRQALTLHASFDRGLDADFSRGEAQCTFQQGGEATSAALNEDVRLAAGAGRFGNALHFPRKGTSRPQYRGAGVLNYNDENWSATVSVWLRLDPDRDLAPGYCDPVQIVGDDSKKGFIFLEWSKDHTPRQFRYAIRPLQHLWNPMNVGWEEIPVEQRPMVMVERAPFASDAWTHAVFTLENLNDDARKPVGKLYLNGQLQGTIQNRDLTLGWDPTQVRLVLGASYVGLMDDLAVFHRALTDSEVQFLHSLPNGARGLYAE